jgi:hypothetical protein
MSIFDSKVDKTLDLHGLFHKLCNYCDNNIHVDSRYFKLLIKHKIDIQLLQDYICNIVEKVLLTHSKYEIHANAETLSIFDFEKYKTFILEMTNTFRGKFTNRLEKCYLYNTSFLFKLMHSFFKRVMSKEDLECIIFVKED